MLHPGDQGSLLRSCTLRVSITIGYNVAKYKNAGFIADLAVPPT